MAQQSLRCRWIYYASFGDYLCKGFYQESENNWIVLYKKTSFLISLIDDKYGCSCHYNITHRMPCIHLIYLNENALTSNLIPHFIPHFWFAMKRSNENCKLQTFGRDIYGFGIEMALDILDINSNDIDYNTRDRMESIKREIEQYFLSRDDLGNNRLVKWMERCLDSIKSVK
eukprot:NODE_72_length_24857_cov_0.454399.p17 type:complete len:172 gc:universal NODE_72_length_24857_cov_0.454399:22384-22899(+)